MADPKAPKTDRLGADYSRGPNPAPGGEIDTGDSAVPPYEGRTGGGGDDPSGTGASVERQMAGAKAGTAGQTASPADEQPAKEEDLSDEEPESPKGVGVSYGRRGEHMSDEDGKEAGRSGDTDDEGGDRPAGTSSERDDTGI